MNFNAIRCACVRPMLCIGVSSGARSVFFGLDQELFFQVNLSTSCDSVLVVGHQVDFGVAFVNPLVLKGISGWCRKTAVLFTRPMITIKSVVPSRDYCNEGFTPKGHPSKGPKAAHQGGDTAQKERTTSGVHQDAFFAPGALLVGRLRECFRRAVRETLAELEREAASPARGDGERLARRRGLAWGEFFAGTDY